MYVCKVEPPVSLNIPGVCIFCNLVCNHTDFLEVEKSCQGRAEWTDFLRLFCVFHLEDEAELAANSNRSCGWGGRLICRGDVPVARHPGEWPDWVILTSCDS